MENVIITRSKVHRLASLIEQDVRVRGLGVGDPYLTASEAGDIFRVNQLTASRAMSLLAGKGMLIRKRGVGTFIGNMKEATEKTTVPIFRTLSVIFMDDICNIDNTRCGFPVGDIVQGLHNFAPGYHVQSSVLHADNCYDMVRAIIQQGSADGSLAGIIMISCPREVQELLLKHNIPTISLGSVYPSTSLIPSVDQDLFEAGKLQAKYMYDRGHRRIMLLMRDIWRQGDNLTVEGIHHAMTEAGLGIGSLIIRSIPTQESIIRNEIHRLLHMEDRPSGLICRCQQFAETAVEVFESESIRVPEDIDIIFTATSKNQPAKPNLARVCSKLTHQEIAGLVAQSLEKLIKCETLENKHIILPVEIVGPKQREEQET